MNWRSEDKYELSFTAIPREEVIRLCDSLIHRTESSNAIRKAKYIEKFRDRLNNRMNKWWYKLFCKRHEPYTLETAEQLILDEIKQDNDKGVICSRHRFTDYYASYGTTWSDIAKNLKQLAEGSSKEVMMTAKDWAVIAKG